MKTQILDDGGVFVESLHSESEKMEEKEALPDGIHFESSKNEIGEVIAVTKLRDYDAWIRRQNIFMAICVVISIGLFLLEIWLAYHKKICYAGHDVEKDGPIDSRFKETCMVSNGRTNALKGLISLVSGIHIILLYTYYAKQVRTQKKAYWFVTDSKVWAENVVPFFLAEVIVLLCHPFPTGSHYLYNDKLGALMFLRMYQFIRVMRDHSPIYQKRRVLLTDRYLKKSGAVEFNWLLCVKYVFLQNSWTFTLCGVVLTWFTMSYIIWIIEREHNYNFSLIVAFWFTCITMATVGYGDVTPSNNSAQVVAGIIAILGIINSSIIVYSVITTLTLSPGDNKINNLWERTQTRARQVELGAEYIRLWWERKKRLSLIPAGAEATAEQVQEDVEFNMQNTALKAELRSCRRSLVMAKELEDVVIERLERKMARMSGDITDFLAVNLGFLPSQKRLAAPTLFGLRDRLIKMEKNLEMMFAATDDIIREIYKREK